MPITGRPLLRRPTLADAAAHFSIHSDPAANRYNPSGPMTRRAESDEIVAEWIESWDRLGFGYWCASLREQPDRIIGFGGIMRKMLAGEQRLNLYFRLAPSVWGRGIATEIGREALKLAAGMPSDNRAFALVRPDNAPSIAVIRKLGMAPVGEVDDVPGAEPSLLFSSAGPVR